MSEKKKAIILDCAGIGAGEIIRNLRLDGFDCAGFDEKMHSISENCNEPFGNSYCAAVFISDSTCRERVENTYAASYGKYMPVLHISREDFSCGAAEEFLEKNMCAGWRLEDELKRRIAYIRERIEGKNPVVNLSESRAGLLTGVMMNEILGDGEKRFVYFDIGESSREKIGAFISEFEKYTGSRVGYIDIRNQLFGVEPPKSDGMQEDILEFMYSFQCIHAEGIYRLYGDSADNRGFAEGPKREFDGVGRSLIYMPFSAQRHPFGYLPYICPCNGLFTDEIKTAERMLGIPQSLIAAYNRL